MISDKEIFSNWLKKKIKFEGIIKGKDLAEKIGVHPSTISGWFGKRSKGPDKDICSKIVDAFIEMGFNFCYDDIVAEGKPKVKDQPTNNLKEQIREVLKEESQIIDLTAVKNTEHHKIVDRFSNPKLAFLINGDLLQLEKLNPKALKKIHNYIKFEIGQTEEDRS